MLLSGLLHIFLPNGFIRRRFRGARGVLSAVTLGIPLPLCSCGVVPAGIGLKNEGASDGASIGFLISTPQTGVDSILVATSFFGWPFAIFKMLAALVTGVVGGLFAERTDKNSLSADAPKKQCDTPKSNASFNEFIAHSVEILRSIWLWLLVGIVISAVIENWMPKEWIESVGSWGVLPAMLLVLVFSTPLYVCATASVPIAAALVAGGMPPAAAMVFLMAGPATNATTMGAIYGKFGTRTLTIYLGSVIAGSMLFGFTFDWLLTTEAATGAVHVHDHTSWIAIASGTVIALLMGWFALESIGKLFRSGPKNSDDAKELLVDGMNCHSCVSKLERELKKNPKVNSAMVQLNPGKAIVTGAIEVHELRQVVTGAGFTPVE